MKKKFLSLILSLFCLAGAAACAGNANPVPQSVPEQRSSQDCPDGNCPDEKNGDCPDGNCPDEKDGDCPDGNCPDEKDGDCPGGDCPGEGDDHGTLPARPVHPRFPDRRPPHFPIRPMPPAPEPTI